jgi:hypothetical protein
MHDAARDEWLSLPNLLKATPSTEGDQRFLYLEASNEARDLQGEVVMAKALASSADYFCKYGNFDIQHRSMLGLASGDPNYHLHEIGRPEKVHVDNSRTFVKGVIFSGDTPVAACANQFWDSLTKLKPPQRWYPSVGGKIQDSEKSVDPKTHQPRRMIKSVIWSNIGFSRTPVNPAVPQVSTVPFGVLAKCWTAGGLDLTKALEAGYGTDSAGLAGGGALRKQSLDGKPQDYRGFRDRISQDILDKACDGTAAAIRAHAAGYGLDDDEADEWSGQFLRDLKHDTKGRH